MAPAEPTSPLESTPSTGADADRAVARERINVELPGGHFDQMIRQTRLHHVHLSALADTKANMLITISAIAITVLFNLLDNPDLRLAAAIMIGGCVVTCCFAVLSSMPGLLRTSGKKRRRSPLFNPLFFGDFTTLSYDEYLAEMDALLNSPSLAYEVQVREIYGIGLYLQHRKYRYLRYAYIALILTVLSSVLIWVFGVLRDEGVLDTLNTVAS